jgi:hypothetical protein
MQAHPACLAALQCHMQQVGAGGAIGPAVVLAVFGSGSTWCPVHSDLRAELQVESPPKTWSCEVATASGVAATSRCWHEGSVRCVTCSRAAE